MKFNGVLIMAEIKKSYHSDRDTQNILQLREVLKDFPPFAKQYFLALEASRESRTRLSYAYDIRTFFRYLQENNPVLRTRDIHTWDVSILDSLSASDIVRTLTSEHKVGTEPAFAYFRIHLAYL